jgi:hypothetical protein
MNTNKKVRVLMSGQQILSEDKAFGFETIRVYVARFLATNGIATSMGCFNITHNGDVLNENLDDTLQDISPDVDNIDIEVTLMEDTILEFVNDPVEELNEATDDGLDNEGNGTVTKTIRITGDPECVDSVCDTIISLTDALVSNEVSDFEEVTIIAQ